MQLLGPPALQAAGSVQALPFDRQHQLLVYLAWRRGWVPRSEIAALLWPEHRDKLAYTNLRKTLHRLQGVEWAAIEQQGHALRLEIETDVQAFEAAQREGRAADAVARRRGELLAGYDDAANEAWTEWLQGERERLRAAWRGAALDHLTADAEPAARITLSAQLLDVDPFDEAALRVQAEALLHEGQHARAQATWRSFIDRLQRELGVEPSAELRAWHDGWSQGGAAAPRRVAGAASGDTARALDGFVGRSGELHRIGALLQPDGPRLITLLGPGGVGKTRLARRVLGELAADFPGGGVFVPMEDVADAARIGERIAREGSVALAGRSDALQQVIAAWRDRQLLLVLDNLEQLATQAGPIEQLLRGCEGLRIVATSRVRLALAEEQLFPLQGLPYPDLEDQDRLEAFDAARLFIRAAQRVEPALVPAAEAAAIIEICRLVDGLPLALELAAAWTRVMSCEAIADELRRGTELLSTADPTRPARQASMAVVFEQAWSHLGAVERRALAALSVFRGGFTAEAARQVAGASAPVLAALADRALLRKEAAGRLQLHPLVQQFAADKLGQGREQRSAADAHALFHLHRLGRLAEPVRRADREALREIDHEFENVRAAWTHAAAAGPLDALGRSAAVLKDHCDARGRLEEGVALLRLAARAPLVAAQPGLQARLAAFAAHLVYRLDRCDEAIAEAERLLATEAAQGDQPARRQCWRLLGSAHLQLGHLDAARRHFERAHDEAAEAGDMLGAAAMLDNVAIVEKRSGRYGEALRLSQQSLTLLRRAGAQGSVALCLNHLGTLYLVQHDLPRAQACFEEGLAICEREGLVNHKGYLLANLAETALRLGALDRAAAFAARASELARTHGYKGIQGWMALQLAQIAVRRGDLPAARTALAEGLQLALELGHAPQLAGAALPLAELIDAQGHRDAARQVLALAMGHPTLSAPDRDEMGLVLQRWGGPSSVPPPSLTIESLLSRALSETDVAYAPLIAALNGRP